MALIDSLVAYWKLDEVSGSRADSHTNAITLTDNNTVGSTTGKLGNAARFVRANSERLSCTDNATVSMGDIDFSISTWIRFTSKPGSMGLLGKCDGIDDATSLEWELFYNSGDDQIQFWISTGAARANVNASNLGSPSTATWYHVVCWHDSVNNQLGIKVNDGTANTAAHTTGVRDSNKQFQLGGENGSRYFDGDIDETGLWKKVLSSTEITTLYGSGTPPDYSTFSGGGAAGHPAGRRLGLAPGCRPVELGREGAYIF